MGWEIKPALLYQASREFFLIFLSFRQFAVRVDKLWLGDCSKVFGVLAVLWWGEQLWFGSRLGLWGTVGHQAPDDTCQSTDLEMFYSIACDFDPSVGCACTEELNGKTIEGSR